jgi:GT2 family glycosyltransferase
MSSRSIGLVGPRIMHYDDPEVLQHGAGFIDGKGWAVNHGHSTTTECDWVTGCGFLVSAEALRTVPEPRGFDERYYAYWEDVDFSYRVAEGGHRVLYEPRAVLFHKDSPATQAVESPTKKRSRQYYTLRNQFLFARRHLPFARRMERFTRAFVLEMPPIVGSWIRRQGLGRGAWLLVRAYIDGLLGRDGRAEYPGLY